LAKTTRQKLGSWGEQAAADYLVAQGYVILGQNVRTHYGEIDLVALYEEPAMPGSAARPVIVFIEVKTRSSAAFGLPEEAVTRDKRAHLLSASQAYMQAHPDLPGDWRIDVIAIRRRCLAALSEIIHFENAVC